MNFDTILDRWENGRSGRQSGRGRRGPMSGNRFDDAVDRSVFPLLSAATGNGNWLDSYPPDARALGDKDDGDSVSRNEVRVNWRRKTHQDVLDLHGLTGEEARAEIGIFIGSMRRRGLRKGLIIHGKGLHSNGQAILGSVVRDYLESSVEVGEFRRAEARHGGSGSTWFLLRQRSR